MKDVSDALAAYLNTQKNMMSCDLYELRLAGGHRYFYTDTDQDIKYGGNTYRHDAMMLKRQQVKLNDSVVVDTMNITIYAGPEDTLEGVPILKAAHDGMLDRSMLYLSRCFFKNGAILGVAGLFGGNVEVKKCGGLQLDLTVKAKTQGLSQEFPRRKYYPQGAYTSAGGTVTAGTSDSDGCLIAPWVPLKEVLL